MDSETVEVSQKPDPFDAQQAATDARGVLLASKGLEMILNGLAMIAISVTVFLTHDHDSEYVAFLFFAWIIAQNFLPVIIHKARRRAGASAAPSGEHVDFATVKEVYTKNEVNPYVAAVVIVFLACAIAYPAWQPIDFLSIFLFLVCLFCAYCDARLLWVYRLIHRRGPMLYHLLRVLSFVCFAILFVIFHGAGWKYLFLFLGIDSLLSGMVRHIRWRRWARSLPCNGGDLPEAQA